MGRPKLLDLFCGAGGCSMGYYRAGFDVVGVDIKPQPHYPFEFIQGDALTFPLEGYDVIHASPPCQGYSVVRHLPNHREYPLLLGEMRDRLAASGCIWIIENVMGAPVQHGVILCGSMFGLQVRRHRFFEISHLAFAPGPCQHREDFVSVFGHCVIRQRTNPEYTGPRCGKRSNLFTSYPLEKGREAMGIDWMIQKELSQAIPPAYTEFIGRQLIEVL